MCLDTHCHLDASEFDLDREAVIERAVATGVAGVLIPAVQAKDFNTVKQLAHHAAHKLPATCYTLGIHPLYTPQAQKQDIATLKQAIEMSLDDPRFVGIGEIGLDYFVPELDGEVQAYFFEEQLALAEQFNLPVILHVRRSQDAIVKALRSKKISGGIAHAFNGSFQQAENFMKLNFVMGFGGAMTHPRALQIRRLAKELPADSIVLETDAPDIPPVWLSGEVVSRNEPGELPQISSELAQLRDALVSQTQHICTQNTLRVMPRWRDLVNSINS
ncbi:TatD family hydrolase [Polynucleobacter sp. MWH-Spelu-300-X4]|uniref:TatD family hydrolase n=1 Tax=Polynucleobacter sp. MWH-Spelu-300-X4 TaxID=2689109 RepID=UPI001BFD6EA5|nr:TatD family hydrolase [Polynucleobacter sp. MWH-Spelu-300-X4]